MPKHSGFCTTDNLTNFIFSLTNLHFCTNTVNSHSDLYFFFKWDDALSTSFDISVEVDHWFLTHCFFFVPHCECDDVWSSSLIFSLSLHVFYTFPTLFHSFTHLNHQQHFFAERSSLLNVKLNTNQPGNCFQQLRQLKPPRSQPQPFWQPKSKRRKGQPQPFQQLKLKRRRGQPPFQQP